MSYKPLQYALMIIGLVAVIVCGVQFVTGTTQQDGVYARKFLDTGLTSLGTCSTARRADSVWFRAQILTCSTLAAKCSVNYTSNAVDAAALLTKLGGANGLTLIKKLDSDTLAFCWGSGVSDTFTFKSLVTP